MSERRLEVIFVRADGSRATVAAVAGDTVMDCALDNAVAGIIGQCGGGCTCCTCHCYVDSPWLERLPQLLDDERDLLEYVCDRRRNSRLSCQIRMTPALDGIVVRLPRRQL